MRMYKVFMKYTKNENAHKLKLVIHIDENNDLQYCGESELNMINGITTFTNELSQYSMDNIILKNKITKYLLSLILTDFDSFQTIDTIIVDHR